jgi:hypothetical protein
MNVRVRLEEGEYDQQRGNAEIFSGLNQVRKLIEQPDRPQHGRNSRTRVLQIQHRRSIRGLRAPLAEQITSICVPAGISAGAAPMRKQKSAAIAAALTLE